DQRANPVNDVLERDVAEGVRVVPVVPLGHSGVVVSKQLELAHAEVLGGLAELSQPRLRDVCRVVAVLTRLDAGRAVSELAVRAGDDDGLDALVGVGGQYSARAGCLVVWVGVDRHQGQWLLIHSSESTSARRQSRPRGSARAVL